MKEKRNIRKIVREELIKEYNRKMAQKKNVIPISPNMNLGIETPFNQEPDGVE